MTWPLHSSTSSYLVIGDDLYDSYQKPCDVGSGFHLPVLLLCRWFGPWSRPKILGAWRHLNMKPRRKRQNKTHCDHCAFSKLIEVIEVIDELQSFGSLGHGPVRLLTRQDFFSWWSCEKRNGPLSSTVSIVPTCFNPWFGHGLGGFSKEMFALVIYTRTPVWMTDPPWTSGLKLQQSKVPRIDSGKKSKSPSKHLAHLGT